MIIFKKAIKNNVRMISNTDLQKSSFYPNRRSEKANPKAFSVLETNPLSKCSH